MWTFDDLFPWSANEFDFEVPVSQEQYPVMQRLVVCFFAFYHGKKQILCTDKLKASTCPPHPFPGYLPCTVPKYIGVIYEISFATEGVFRGGEVLLRFQEN